MPPKYTRDDFRRFKEICPAHMLGWLNEQLSFEMEARGWPVGAAPLPVNKPGILTIDHSKPFNPAGFSVLFKGFSIAEPEDGRSLALGKIDPALIHLETTLRAGEKHIVGNEKLRRLKAAGHTRLDAKVLEAFLGNQHCIPEHWKNKTNGRTTVIFFDGTILQYPSGAYCVLCFCWNGGEWHWGYVWLGNDWGASDPSAVLIN